MDILGVSLGGMSLTRATSIIGRGYTRHLCSERKVQPARLGGYQPPRRSLLKELLNRFKLSVGNNNIFKELLEAKAT